MPLDGFGYPGFGGGSEHKAMLIVPDGLYLNSTTVSTQPDSSTSRAWIQAAKTTFAHEHQMNVAQIYVAASSKVTSGHLTRYPGRVLVFGVRDGLIEEGFHDTRIAGEKLIGKDVVTMRSIPELPGRTIRREVGYYYFPDKIDRIIEQQHTFGVSVAYDGYRVYGAHALPQEIARPNQLVLTLGKPPTLDRS